MTAVFGGVSPPKANEAVEVPIPAKNDLAVFKSFTSVQFVPSYNSVTADGEEIYPPKAKAAV